MTMNMRLLLLLLFGSVVMYTSCQSTSAPIDSLAARVTENTSKDQILFRLVTDETDPAKDYFEIDSKDGKVLITGNSDLSLATGLNWYLKYVAGIHLSWNNPSQKLPEVLPLPQKKIRQATAMKNRYYLNYCTYSYSMAFWDWERWEKEIDWMAMHGINMPLSITGMEVVWYNLLKRIGYTTEEINEFISGPAFMAWWQMNNLEGWGGPNPDSWYRQQEALQKKIIARMRELGIEPVFPGYSRRRSRSGWDSGWRWDRRSSMGSEARFDTDCPNCWDCRPAAGIAIAGLVRMPRIPAGLAAAVRCCHFDSDCSHTGCSLRRS